MEKVLVACPTYEGMAYCFNEFIEKLRDIDYENFKIVIFDNSRTKGFFRKIKKNPFMKVVRDETTEEKNIDRLISSRNKILEYAIQKNFDYILMLDSDVMVPKNVLKRLIGFGKDVVSGIYFTPFKFGGKLVNLPVAFRPVSEEEFEKLGKERNLPTHAKKPEDMMKHLNQEDLQKELVKVKIPSGGCLLLSRKAFTSGARYGLEDFPDEIYTTDDVYFFNRLREKGFELFCAPKVLCKHKVKGKYSLNKGIHPLRG